MIKEPVQPEPPVYEDLQTIPDLQCEWDDEGWEGGNHQGLRCKVCGEITQCEFCVRGVKVDLNCLRNQAEERNFERKRQYKRACERYEAQMEYYREIVGGDA